jgi:hypothetical protein
MVVGNNKKPRIQAKIKPGEVHLFSSNLLFVLGMFLAVFGFHD